MLIACLFSHTGLFEMNSNPKYRKKGAWWLNQIRCTLGTIHKSWGCVLRKGSWSCIELFELRGGGCVYVCTCNFEANCPSEKSARAIYYSFCTWGLVAFYLVALEHYNDGMRKQWQWQVIDRPCLHPPMFPWNIHPLCRIVGGLYCGGPPHLTLSLSQMLGYLLLTDMF